VAASRPPREVVVLGAGLYRHGIYPDIPFIDMGAKAINEALQDATIKWEDIEVGYCAYTNLGNAAGHIMALHMGSNGITMTNVENASASGSAAFREAYLSVASGAHEIALAIGIDKLNAYRQDKSEQSQKRSVKAPVNTSMMRGFAELAHKHMHKYGTTVEQMAMVSVKSHFNGSLNRNAHYQQAVTLEEVFQARMVVDPLTVLHCCPWDEGAAAVILCAEEEAAKRLSF
jgi:acetyl-CoA acetyltransferase